MRRWLSFDVAGSPCAASLDEGASSHGLLIVSGGNETRAGAHRGMARLATMLAATGHPVLRFDRRGVGDSAGDNLGFEAAGEDIAAAAALFRTACPHITRITAFGNCDAASALALHHAVIGVEALLLANPWTIDAALLPGHDSGPAQPTLPPAAAIRARYAAKLRDPGEWLRLIGGGVSVPKLLRGLRAAGGTVPSALGERMARSLNGFAGRVEVLIAEGDATAQAFLAEWQRPAFAALRQRAALHRHPTGSHSFADAAAQRWLDDQILAALQ